MGGCPWFSKGGNTCNWLIFFPRTDVFFGIPEFFQETASAYTPIQVVTIIFSERGVLGEQHWSARFFW